MTNGETVVLGADHAGLKMKQMLAEHLRSEGYDVHDVGTMDEASVDYPDIAAAAARMIGRGDASRGILVCGSGLGVAIAANKVDGVRAVTANELELARLSREHNDANLLALGARFIGDEKARQIADLWLGTEFEGGRHQQRVSKISDIEKGI